MWIDGTRAERISLLRAAPEHVLAQENGKKRCVQAVRKLAGLRTRCIPGRGDPGSATM